MTAPSTYTRSNVYKIPRGMVAFQKRRTDGTFEGMRFLGNCPGFDLTVETENYQHINSEGGLNTVDLDVAISVTRSSSITVDNMSNDNLAVFLAGSIEDFTQVTTAVTNEAITGYQASRSYQLGESQSVTGVRNVGSVTVEFSAAARVNSTAYTAGTVLFATTTNNHAYLCTVAGTSGASEPTYNVAGGTHTDGTATFKDLGVVTSLTAGTDYVLDAALGLVSVQPTGKLASAYTAAKAALGSEPTLSLAVDYTPAANTRTQIKTGSSGAVEGRVRFIADNPYGEQQDVTIPLCTLKPSGTLPFIGEGEAASITFEVGISLLDSATPAVIVEDRGA